eukprot:4973397-Amphidinium_carterae.1
MSDLHGLEVSKVPYRNAMSSVTLMCKGTSTSATPQHLPCPAPSVKDRAAVAHRPPKMLSQDACHSKRKLMA